MSRAAALLASLAVTAAPSAEPKGAAATGWFDVRSFGARGDGKTDDSRAIQAALDAARVAGGGVVYVPPGTYLVAPPRPAKGSPALASMTIGSRTWLRGDGAASVLKVRDGVGSYRALLSNHPHAGSPVEDVTISDLRFDQNCGASGGSVGHVADSRSDFMVYLAWGGRNLTVERVRFDPVCGGNTVVLNSPHARNLVVRDCIFRFVKGPTAERSGEYDNSAVYVHGQGAEVTGNLFEAGFADGARGAIELHGARGLAANNVTRGYRSCVRVVGTSEQGETVPGVQNGFTVAGNVCTDAMDAINVWSLTGHHVRGVTIVGNTIALAEVDHLAVARYLEHFSGIAFVWYAVSGKLNGDISDVVIEGNTIAAQPSQGTVGRAAYSSAGISLTASGNISNVVVRGNVVRDVPAKGIHLEPGRGASASAVRIEGNVILDAGNDPAAGFHRAGIMLGGLLEDVEVDRNSIVSRRVPFRGLYAIRAAPSAGSRRVGVHDNVWSVAEPGAAYQLALEGEVDAGPDGRTMAATAPARDGGALTLDASRARIWDVSVTAPSAFTIRAPSNAARGQRLTIRVRNDHAGALGAIRWEGFKMASWTSPAPGYHRVLEVLWDGRSWCELSRTPADVPN